MGLLEKCIFYSKRSELKHMFSSEQKKVNRVGASTFLLYCTSFLEQLKFFGDR